MCSLELLELVEHMPDEGAFKTAARGGEWCQRDKALYQIANELAVLRAAQVPGIDAERYGSTLFIPESTLRQMSEDAELQRKARESVFVMADRTGEIDA